VKLIAYDSEVERLANLIAVIETCGFANHLYIDVQNVFSKNKPKCGKNTVKFVVKIERSHSFEKEYLSETKYIEVKESLIKKNISINEYFHSNYD
jgi:hypothetical protein